MSLTEARRHRVFQSSGIPLRIARNTRKRSESDEKGRASAGRVGQRGFVAGHALRVCPKPNHAAQVLLPAKGPAPLKICANLRNLWINRLFVCPFVSSFLRERSLRPNQDRPFPFPTIFVHFVCFVVKNIFLCASVFSVRDLFARMQNSRLKPRWPGVRCSVDFPCGRRRILGVHPA